MMETTTGPTFIVALGIFIELVGFAAITIDAFRIRKLDAMVGEWKGTLDDMVLHARTHILDNRNAVSDLASALATYLNDNDTEEARRKIGLVVAATTPVGTDRKMERDISASLGDVYRGVSRNIDRYRKSVAMLAILGTFLVFIGAALQFYGTNVSAVGG